MDDNAETQNKQDRGQRRKTSKTKKHNIEN